jgi:imidazolonepropionase-like amidohydrolase
MIMRFKFLFTAFLMLLVPNAALADWTIIHAGTLLAVPGEAPLNNASIIIHDDRIFAVQAGFLGAEAIKAGEDEAVNIIDLSGRFVLPGLIDSHVHLTGDFGTPQLERLLMSAEYSTLLGARNAGITLRAGFTTVADVGSARYAAYALRDAIAAGIVEGPRILAGGASISVTAGHADPTNSLPDAWWASRDDVGISQCNGADECRYRVRLLAKRGADLIKITATGGVLSQSGRGLDQHFTMDEMEAIVEAAHLLGLRVTAHAHGTEGIKAAIRAGIDSIQHSTLIDAEGAALAREHGTYLVPTLMAPWGAEQAREMGLLSPVVMAKMDAVMSHAAQSHEFMFSDGIKIAFGTDAGVYPHGMNAMEFARMIAASDMSPMDAIRSATVTGAQMWGREDDIGTIEAGKYADIIAVDGNPLEDVSVLEQMAFVMKGGQSVALNN